MLVLVMGGSASGKSALAEHYAATFGGPLLYVATMKPAGAGGRERIEKHRHQRAGYGFVTLEHYTSLQTLYIKGGYTTALVECIGNLTANEMFSDWPPCIPEQVEKSVLAGIENLLGQVENLVVVTNNVFGDGQIYEEATLQYLQALGTINRKAASLADAVVEAVCGLPLMLKGGELLP